MFPAKPQSTDSQFSNGQSLIEIIATIAIGTVLILALVALSVRSNSASDFSKAQNQASRLASEGLEIINSLRASSVTSTPITYATAGGCATSGGNTAFSWNEFFTNDIDPETGSGCDQGRAGHLNAPGVSGCPVGENWCLNLTTGGVQTPAADAEGRVFTRTVYVADTPIASGGNSKCNIVPVPPATQPDFSKIKQFTVVVSWSDSSGSHNSTTTSCIQK